MKDYVTKWVVICGWVYTFGWPVKLICFDPQLLYLLLNCEFTNVILINTNFSNNIIKVKLKKKTDVKVTHFYPFLSIIFSFSWFYLNKCFYPFLPNFTHRFPFLLIYPQKYFFTHFYPILPKVEKHWSRPKP